MNIITKASNNKYAEVITMNCTNENKSIRCSVEQCRHHCTTNYCTLDTVSIGTHEANPTQPECVDCNSFEKK